MQIQEKIERCDICNKEKTNRPEPMLQSESPARPWQMVGTDLFEWNGNSYVLVVAYLSRFPELAKLESTTSSAVITHLKSIFSRHGIPEIVRSDNGPQYASEAFKQFARDYNFDHITSSPHYPQSNGEAERMVQTIKNLLKKAKDPYAAIMAYRATPLSNGFSPAEILMGRRLRTTVPMVHEQLVPRQIPWSDIVEKDKQSRETQKQQYDKSHRAKQLPPLEDGAAVFLQDRREHGRVLSKASSPRSYYVVTPSGTFRRNRKRLIVANERVDTEDEDDDLPEVPDAQEPAQQQAEEPDIEVEGDDAEGENQPPANNVESVLDEPVVGAEEGARVVEELGEEAAQPVVQDNQRTPAQKTTKSGRPSKPPDRYSPS